MDVKQIEVQAQAQYLARQRESAGNDAAVMAGRLAACNALRDAAYERVKELEAVNKELEATNARLIDQIDAMPQTLAETA